MNASSYPKLGLLVDGAWRNDDGTREILPVFNPATGELLGRLPMATAADIQDAVAAAERAFAGWKKVPALERARVLQRICAAIREKARELATILTLEQGKTLREAAGEIASTADTFEWMAEEARRIYGRVVPARTRATEQLVLQEPVGPVGAFAPWNYPAILSARKIAPALAAGCTIVLKPAEETPGVLVAIAQLCVEAGVPAGVLNVLYGNPAMISKAVIQAPQIRHLSFTGSVPVGRELAALAGRELKQITLELGGHSAAIIDRNVALDTVVELSVAAKFRNAGQICHAPARFLVHESVCDEFVARFAARANALRVGNGLREDVQMGPLIHERRQAAVRRMTQDAVAGGAQLVCGGEALAEAGGGSFWRPTVLLNAAPDSLAMTEEIFGPVALVMPYKDIDEAIALANGTRYGLAAYAFTNSANHMHLLQQELHAGSVAFNTYAVSCAELPFSGWGDSGVGSESGPEGLMAYLHTKSVIKAF